MHGRSLFDSTRTIRLLDAPSAYLYTQSCTGNLGDQFPGNVLQACRISARQFVSDSANVGCPDDVDDLLVGGWLKSACRAILADFLPVKNLTVHGDINTMRKRLHCTES